MQVFGRSSCNTNESQGVCYIRGGVVGEIKEDGGQMIVSRRLIRTSKTQRVKQKHTVGIIIKSTWDFNSGL